MSLIRVLAKECVEPGDETESGVKASEQQQRYARGLRKRKQVGPSSSLTPASESIEMNGRQDSFALNPLNNNQQSLSNVEQEEYMVSWRRILLLIMEVTVHNIPGL
jgi:hypothetical protein